VDKHLISNPQVRAHQRRQGEFAAVSGDTDEFGSFAENPDHRGRSFR